MQSKSIHEPFIRVVKRGEMPMKKKIADSCRSPFCWRL